MDTIWEIKDCSYNGDLKKRGLSKACDCIKYDWGIVGGGRTEFEFGSTCKHLNEQSQKCVWWNDGCSKWHCKDGEPDYKTVEEPGEEEADPDCTPSEDTQYCMVYDIGHMRDHDACRSFIDHYSLHPDEETEVPECEKDDVQLQCLREDKIAGITWGSTECIPTHKCEHVIVAELTRLGYTCERQGVDPCQGLSWKDCKQESKCKAFGTKQDPLCVTDQKTPRAQWNYEEYREVCEAEKHVVRDEDTKSDKEVVIAECERRGCRWKKDKCRTNAKKIKCKNVSPEYCKHFEGCSMTKKGCKGSHKWTK